MAISKKLPSMNNKIEELISKGGSVSNYEEKTDLIKNLQLRLPQNLIQQIDKYCQDERYKVKKSRHGWILEAIIEKIDKTEKTNSN